ncbi:MAG: glycogen debranching enzyme family protein [Phycisphaeraceae bacterium]|nr:glycogen debranching enzyme family protein [Phycisphaeraceae bacterium]
MSGLAHGPWNAREWLLTNRWGGFAMGTLSGIPTRRYHAWLVSARRPPVDRIVVLHSAAEWLVCGGSTIDCASYAFGADPVIHPRGVEQLAATDVGIGEGVVAWSLRTALGTLRRRLLFPKDRQAVRLEYQLSRDQAVTASDPVRLLWRPFVPLRDFHAVGRAAGDGATPTPSVTIGRGEIRVARGGTVCVISMPPGCQPVGDAEWWNDFALVEERARGLDWREDLWSPGLFSLPLPDDGSPCALTAWIEWTSPTDPFPAAPLPVHRTGAEGTVEARLRTAADQFIARRIRGEDVYTTILAGYPWFADWGRDAMISLPGLLLVDGRYAEARSVLELFASEARRGLLPNCFDDRGAACVYHSADAPLWFIHALAEYVRLSGDRDIHELRTTAREIVGAFIAGTDFGIRIDDEDGLLQVGSPDQPVTWMDAARDGQAFTPRVGKPVELNALWYRALLALADITEDPDERAWLISRAQAFPLAFARFWWPARTCLHDVLERDGSGGWRGDGRVRPNQIFAVSLPIPLLDEDRRAAVIATVERDLLTPRGLRTLAPWDPHYRSRYEGSLVERDAAYHQGTAWPWLLGPLAEAVLRHEGFTPAARSRAMAILAPIVAALGEACEGQIAEVYDGDAPQRPSGCPAQAWSVAEVRRVLQLAGG